MTKTVIIIVIAVLAVVGISYGAYYFRAPELVGLPRGEDNNTIEPPIIEQPVEQPVVEVKDFSTKYYQYELQRVGDFGRGLDQKLVRQDRNTGQKTVVIESIKSVIPELKEKFNLILSPVAHSENSYKIIFRVILDSTDAPPGNLYAFNVNTQEFNRMKINDFYSGAGILLVSPNSRQAAHVGQKSKDKKLYLFDFINDAAKSLVILESNETFNKGGAFGGEYDIKWLNDSEIQYSVFDKTQIVSGPNDPYIYRLIEKRMVSF